jgi:hypothetical protein
MTGPRADGVLIDAVKRVNDRDKLASRILVLRMFESMGGRSQVAQDVSGSRRRGAYSTHSAGLRPVTLTSVNVLEEKIRDVP